MRLLPLLLIAWIPALLAVGLRLSQVPRHPGVPDAELHWYRQPLDHSDFTEHRTWAQRYFSYDRHWAPGGPIMFYCGNEANVELYVNATGLMWERASELHALLIFAEHRYYGESMPLGAASVANASTLRYLTMEQALSDYANLIYDLKANFSVRHGVAPSSLPVVALGGSYGGMLAAWLRFHYPNAVAGALAASAPVLAFDGLSGDPTALFDSNKYWQVVTRDASVKEGGCVDGCVDGVRATWPALAARAATSAGRAWLTKTFKLCGPGISGATDVLRLTAWLLNLWDTLAMGNFPYPSNYLVFQQTQDANVTLPAWPFRAACAPFAGATSATPADDLLSRMSSAAAVLYNVSGTEQCYNLPTDPNYDGIWDWQWCTERLPQETYFTLDGLSDMFFSQPMNRSAIAEHCERKYGVRGITGWIAKTGRIGAGTASNILFSNGEYDPWRSGGVLTNLSLTLRTIEVAQGAHHLDLFFTNAADPPSLTAVREAEVAAMKAWITGNDSW